MAAGTPRQTTASPSRPARQDLGHLGDVAEHVGQVARPHRLTEGLRARPSHLEVADERLARDQELVHEDLPRTDGQPAARDVARQPGALLGTDLEVVVHRGQLPVEGEGEVGLGLEHVEDAVDKVDQLHPEALKGADTTRGPSACAARGGSSSGGAGASGGHSPRAYRVGARFRVRRMT